MKRMLLVGMIGTMLLTGQKMDVQARFVPMDKNTVISESNSNMVHGKVLKAVQKKGKIKITMKCQKNTGKYKNMKYSITVPKNEPGAKRFLKKEGKKCTVILYTGYTKTVKDDEIVNIRLGRF